MLRNRTEIKIPLSSKPFEGFFHYFRRIYSPGIVENGLVSLFVKEPGFLDDFTDQIVENNSLIFWHLLGRENNYLMFNFTSFRVSVSGVSIQTISSSGYAWKYNPSFSIEVSNNSDTWNEVYREDESPHLKTLGSHHSWTFPQSYPIQYIRFISLKDLDGKKSHGIYISIMEFFGTIFDPFVIFHSATCTSSHSFYFPINICFIIIYFIST